MPPKKLRKTASGAGISPADSTMADSAHPSTTKRNRSADDDPISVNMKSEDGECVLSPARATLQQTAEMKSRLIEQELETEHDDGNARRAAHAAWADLERRKWKKRETDLLARLEMCRRRLRELDEEERNIT